MALTVSIFRNADSDYPYVVRHQWAGESSESFFSNLLGRRMGQGQWESSWSPDHPMFVGWPITCDEADRIKAVLAHIETNGGISLGHDEVAA